MSACNVGCGCVCHQQSPSPTPTPDADPLGLRNAVILVIAFLAGVVSGVLTFMANGSNNVPGAVLAGLGTMALTFFALHKPGR